MTDLPEGHYCFEVTSYIEGLGQSNPIKLSFDLVHSVILAPIGLAVEVINGNDILLTWKPTDYTKIYNVYRFGLEGKGLVETVITTRFVA